MMEMMWVISSAQPDENWYADQSQRCEHYAEEQWPERTPISGPSGASPNVDPCFRVMMVMLARDGHSHVRLIVNLVIHL